MTNVLIEAGQTYTVTFWARSLLSDAYLTDMQQGIYRNGTHERATLEAAIVTQFGELATLEADVSPRTNRLNGECILFDDGFAVWIDGEYCVAPLVQAY